MFFEKFLWKFSEISRKSVKTRKKRVYTLVGVQEIDPLQGRISVSSPVGQALIGKKKGAIVPITVPRGAIEYSIIEIEYK